MAEDISKDSAGSATTPGADVQQPAKTVVTPTEAELKAQEALRLAKAYYAGYIVYFIAVVALIIYGMRTGRNGWFYAAAVLLIAPAAGSIVGGGIALFGKPKKQ